jgi:hypothetical protein
MLRHTLLLGALATCALLVANVDARADYSYTTGTVTLSPSPFAGATETISTATAAVTSNNITVPTLVSIAYSNIVTGQTGVQTVSWTESLTSFTGSQPGTGVTTVLTVSCVLSLSTATGAVVVTNPTGTATQVSNTGAGGTPFTMTNFQYTLPISATTPGQLAFQINPSQPTGVPEPASLVMLGSGLIGVAGLGLRRLRNKKKAE